eukprot:TRINITY_DN113723_c0_g1_i1.p1 TRINITY_DN113723_c0_g1~~TRINITY_DN113723_c0_g1_i1.p1  ORF type:complete len:588 (+),score=146.21 TRINITY_DN113723_c0_g1_i1:139-1902(+)
MMRSPAFRRTANRRQRPLVKTALGIGLGLVALLACVSTAFSARGHEGRISAAALAGGGARRLEESYPPDPFLKEPYEEDPRRWLVILHAIGICYMLLGLNTVCDMYFTGALEHMVNQWNIKPDVAGATFMAAGGSAPELFTSLIATTIVENDVGFGTIVGSAVFNVLFVIGACGLVATEEITLTWWPLFRDCSYYSVGLASLAFFAADGTVSFLEALILFIGYLVYCVIMYFNPVLEEWTDFEYWKAMRKAKEEKARKAEEEPQECPPTPPPKELSPATSSDKLDEDKAAQNAEGEGKRVTWKSSVNGNERGTGLKLDASTIPKKVRASACLTELAKQRHQERMHSLGEAGARHETQSEQGDQGWLAKAVDEVDTEASEPGDEGDGGDLMDMPSDPKDLVMWVLSLPIYAPLYYGIPVPDEKWFMCTFLVSLVWIAGFSFFLVWWVEILGTVLHVPTIIMALTVLAAGTSIPDAVSSMSVARLGEGDMAVSSSIGSNIFDILVGLPIPWMLKTAVIEGLDHRIVIKSPFLTFYVLLLLCMVLLVILSIHLLGWKLNRMLGLCMAMLYVIFLTASVSVEHFQWEFLKV